MNRGMASNSITFTSIELDVSCKKSYQAQYTVVLDQPSNHLFPPGGAIRQQQGFVEEVFIGISIHPFPAALDSHPHWRHTL